MNISHRSDQLYLIGVREQVIADDCTRVTFLTTRRNLNARAHYIDASSRAAILLDDDTFDMHADAEFGQIVRDLGMQGIASVRLDYRFPGDRAQCAIDALLACQYLDDEGINDVMLVGWSFGAAVALAAGSVGRIVRGVAAIYPPDLPECCVNWIGKKRLVVMDDGRNICQFGADARNVVPIRHYSREKLTKWIWRTLDFSRRANEDSLRVLAH